MATIDINGLVLGETAIGDNKKYIKILTDKLGKISAIAYGTSGMKSKYFSAVKPFSYSSFTLTEKNGSYTLKEAELKTSFFKISSDVKTLALGSYIVSVADFVSNEEDDSTDLLSLSLNSLYALVNAIRPPQIIKAVFELKCASVIGFSPSVIACSNCNKDIVNIPSFMKIYDGNTVCKGCLEKGAMSEYEVLMPLSPSVVSAIRYVIISDIKKMFNFTLEDQDLNLFSELAEKYLSAHIEKGFSALEIYKTLTE